MPRKRATMKTNTKSFNLIPSYFVSLCAAVLLSSFTVLASETGPGSGNGTDGFALQGITAENSGLSVYEQYVKAFEESENNKINLEWEAGERLGNGVRVTEVSRLISRSGENDDTISLYYVNNGNLDHVTKQAIIKLEKKIIRNPFGTSDYGVPNLTINYGYDGYGYFSDRAIIRLVSEINVLTTKDSIVTTEDNYGHKWEVRQFDSKTIIFVKYPNKNSKCGQQSELPQNGYCMVGVIFND